MKKNVIVILVDSVFSECISNKRTTETSTPFLDKLSKEGIFTDSIYSYGPYTDAATKGLFTGRPTLDDYGYYYSINEASSNFYKAFKEQGYETYGFYYPYYLIGKNIEKYIDHSIFTEGFLYQSVWFGKLGYYGNIKKTRELTDTEYLLVEKCIELVFESLDIFYSVIEKDRTSSEIIDNIKVETEFESGEKLLKEEEQLYFENKVKYVNEVLDKGMDHNLAKINNFDPAKCKDNTFLKSVYRENRFFFKNLSKNHYKLNNKNNKSNLLLWLKEFLKNGDKKHSKIVNYLLCLYAPYLSKKRSFSDNWQLGPSLNTQVNQLIKILTKRENKETPFFSFIHTEEPHNYISYFSYDSNDKNLVKEEIEYLKPLINNLGKDFKGNSLYQLALRYDDLCIKRLFDKLKKINLLDNTEIVITADHGSSYTYYPIRDSVVNNFYTENYKTPLILWNSNKEPQKLINRFYSAEDVLPSIFSSLDLPVPKDMTGIPIMNNAIGRDYIITEYMGPGCPDMVNRPIWLSIRNKNYHICCLAKLDNEFNTTVITEIYNLEEDKYQQNNLIKTNSDILNNEEILDLFNKLNLRFNEIKLSCNDFISKLK